MIAASSGEQRRGARGTQVTGRRRQQDVGKRERGSQEEHHPQAAMPRENGLAAQEAKGHELEQQALEAADEDRRQPRGDGDIEQWHRRQARLGEGQRQPGAQRDCQHPDSGERVGSTLDPQRQ